MRDLYHAIPAFLTAMFAISGQVNAAAVSAYGYSIAVQSGSNTSPSPNISSLALSPLVTVPYQAPPITAGQDLHTATGAAGPVTANSAASGSGLSSFGAWTEAGSSSGTGNYGVLSVNAAGTATGHGDSGTLVGHEAYVRFADTLTFTNGSGSHVAHLTISVTGQATVNTRGFGDLSIFYWEAGSSTAQEAFRFLEGSDFGSNWTVRNDGSYLVLNGTNQTTLPSSLTQSSTGYGLSAFLTHIDLPFTYGAPVDFSALLFGSAIPGGGNTADVFATATLSGITVDGNGNPNIVSASGTVYDILGAHPTADLPEPATATLLLTFFGGLGATRRWRRRIIAADARPAPESPRPE